MVQAILRWDCDDGKVAKAPRISHTTKYRILLAFRVMQRCRTWDDWPVAKAQFLKDTHAIIFAQGSESLKEDELGENPSDEEGMEASAAKHPAQKRTYAVMRYQKSHEDMATQWSFVEKHFCENWFTNEWIRMCNPAYQRALLILYSQLHSQTLVCPLDKHAMGRGM